MRFGVLGSDEEPWFVAADIGKVLGIKHMGEYLKGNKDGSEKGEEDVLTPGGVQKMIVLSEMADLQISHAIPKTPGRTFPGFACRDRIWKRGRKISLPLAAFKVSRDGQ